MVVKLREENTNKKCWCHGEMRSPYAPIARQRTHYSSPFPVTLAPSIFVSFLWIGMGLLWVSSNTDYLGSSPALSNLPHSTVPPLSSFHLYFLNFPLPSFFYTQNITHLLQHCRRSCPHSHGSNEDLFSCSNNRVGNMAFSDGTLSVSSLTLHISEEVALHHHCLHHYPLQRMQLASGWVALNLP